MHLTYPNGNALAETARGSLKPAVGPIQIPQRLMEARLTIEAVEIRADELAIFHPNPGLINEVGNAAGRINSIIQAIYRASFRLKDFDAFAQPLLQD
jgi:hypothetical protein